MNIKSKSLNLYLCLILFVLCHFHAFSQLSVTEDIVSWGLFPQEITLPADDADVRIELTGNIKQDWHVYANPKGPGTGLPLQISVEAIPSATIIYPEGEKFNIPDLDEWVYAYHHQFKVVVVIKKASLVASPESLDLLTLNIKGLVCKDACVPINHSLTIPIRPSSGVNVDKTENTAPSSDSSFSLSSLLGYIILGVLAGLFLNFMPCVLPVLSLKILSVLSLGQKRAMSSALFYTLGVMLVFTVLASLMAFAGLMWGQQFQEPRFLIALGVVVIFFVLSLFDLFQVSLFSQTVSSLEGKVKDEGFFQDFSKGVAATLLATPCSGPFLGGTLFWASQQTPLIIFSVYMSVGAGMALPFVLIVLIPGFRKCLPKPGGWMVKFKEGSAFLMIATLIYLLSIITPDLRIPVMFYFLAVSFLGWTYASFDTKWIKIMTLVVLVGISIPVFTSSFSHPEASQGTHIAENQFSLEKVRELRLGGQTVVVDFTADWCPNCKVVEKLVLQSATVESLLKQDNVTFLIADLTVKNQPAEEELLKLGGKAIPFLAIYPADIKRSPLTLRDIYTVDQFVKKFKEATL